ncbi:hypothetical protein [Amycolatopsis antarctica]|uniref:hypothetical protein n=1 Tax=Amycolatopsis antarctica TaxID=1854586 RepID=UPI00196B601D|nr:hypothetical protein [Amycolatopsis antarctica]
MNDLESRAEILKLARVLDTAPDRLGFLAEVPAADLRAFREQATDLLFDANEAVLQRMALASKLVPAPVLAKIAQRVFGPLLCARIAGLVDVARGVDVASRLSPTFLADVAAQLDPRRASRIIARIPGDTVAAVASELTRREDWITIGRFVGSLPDSTVSASLEALDDSALLQSSYVLDDKSRAGNVVELLPAKRYLPILRAADAGDLWPHTLDLLTHLDEPLRARFAEAAAELESGSRSRVVAAARELGLDPDLLLATTPASGPPPSLDR